ncbi:META domain-containing protein [Shewanella psychropiezotolerans]|uniref:META domain-containing protein n=1 Tax=Shewanella psychropiezotolerans TaxID=2593655 RepID=A0ABX5WYD7_9GAMM|nr:MULTISPECIES: META domain-containing protein [Shewanella]MPY23100.1 META domain-containing protein [Shewanella sp. YLB-07]QDO82753.1 META domain-containing protein [Shewanella psychropiezotolerans]
MSLKSFLIASTFFALSACQSTPEPESLEIALAGTWHIEVIAGNPVIDYSPAQLIFSQEGKLSGNNSCNSFFGEYSLQGSSITLSPAGHTMKACVDALMNQEQRVMTAIPKVTSGQIVKSKLVLKDANGKTQFVLSKL